MIGVKPRESASSPRLMCAWTLNGWFMILQLERGKEKTSFAVFQRPNPAPFALRRFFTIWSATTPLNNMLKFELTHPHHQHQSDLCYAHEPRNFLSSPFLLQANAPSIVLELRLSLQIQLRTAALCSPRQPFAHVRCLMDGSRGVAVVAAALSLLETARANTFPELSCFDFEGRTDHFQIPDADDCAEFAAALGSIVSTCAVS